MYWMPYWSESMKRKKGCGSEVVPLHEFAPHGIQHEFGNLGAIQLDSLIPCKIFFHMLAIVRQCRIHQSQVLT